MRLLIALVIVGISPGALAHHEVESYASSANTGGSSGLYYTGSKRYKGYDCGLCHLGAERRVSIELDSALSAGTYRPGLIYPITLRLVGEHRGLDSAFNPNTFTADFTDAQGVPVGLIASGGNRVLPVQEGKVAVAEGFGEGETEWSFSWWAPDEAVPVVLHVSMLDGDGASDPVRRFIDPLNDDFATLRLVLCPDGERCAPEAEPEAEVAPMGCALADDSLGTSALLLLLGFLVLRRRTRWSVSRE